MILPPVVRRSLAIVATTALMTSGAAGLFTGTANAVPNTGTISGVSPQSTNNSGNSGLTVTGSGFVPASDHVLLAPQFQSAYGSAGTPGLEGTTNQQTSDDQTLDGQIPSANAAPGKYDVYTARYDGATTTLSPKWAGGVFTINSSGLPSVSNVVPGVKPSGGVNRPAIPLDLTGQNLAQGSYVTFFKADNATPDTGLMFTVGDPNYTDKFSGYVSSTSLHGSYSHDGAFTPGKHFIQVKNTVGEVGGAVEFWQPTFAAGGVSPNSTGAGTQSKVITVTGEGIRQGSRLSISAVDLDPTPIGNTPDVTVGSATVSADGKTISAPVTVDPDADTSVVRTVTISGTDGGTFSVPNAFTVNQGPHINSLSEPALGQGAFFDEKISGSGFASAPAGSAANLLPVFSVSGTGVTTKTLSSTNIEATVRFTVAPDAPAEARTITVSNPDGGTEFVETDSGGNDIFTVNDGPKITSLTPASTAAGTSKTVTIKGSNFDPGTTPGSPKATVTISQPPAAGATRVPDPSISVGSVTWTPANPVTGAPEQLSFTVSVAGNAPAGLRDVVVFNPSDQGAALCAGCFGVDNLTASPSTGSNSGTKQIALTGANVVAGSTAKLVRAGDPNIQPNISGTSTTVSGTTLTAIFDLTDAAPGPYNAVVTTPSGVTLSCSSCFTVTGSTPSITSISPAAGGQGANNLPITVTGTNFSRGEQLTITDVLVHDVVWVSRTQLTAKVDIANDAATGAKDAKVTNADGALSGTKTGAFTVNAPPNPTASSPASYGQGAKGVKITVTGPNFDAGAKVSFGAGVTVTGVAVTQGQAIPVIDPNPDDTLEATVTIAEDAPAVQRDVVVTNSDGGVGTLTNGFAVNFGPKVTGVTPGFLAPNAVDKPITIAGSNFSTTAGKTAVPTIAGVTLKNVVVAADGNSITATASVNSGTAKGGKDVVVTNPTDSGVGTCASCLYVATPPGAPTALGLVSRTASSITVKWTPPSDNGGAPITSYVVSAKDSTGHAVGTAGTTAGNAVQGTVSGLKSTTAYTVLVVARNAAGDSTPGSMSASTTGANQFGGSFTTSTHSPSLTTTGGRVTLSGRLLKVDTGTPIVGATVELALVPDIGSAVFPKVTTNSNGVWSFGFNPVYSNTIKTLYRGDASHDPYQAPSYRMGVSTRVTLTSPINGSTTSARNPLIVTGGTTPNKHGNRITLYRWNGSFWAAVQNVTVASNGTYRFSYTFGRGNWTLKVGIGRTTGNFVGYSPAIGVHRV